MTARYVTLLIHLMILLTGGVSYADNACRFQMTFVNQDAASPKSLYKLGVDLAKSTNEVRPGVFEPLNSRKTVWTQYLSFGQSTTRTITVRFKGACDVSRRFRFHICWRRAGAPGGPRCASPAVSDVAQPGPWLVTHALVSTKLPKPGTQIRTTISGIASGPSK